MTVPPLPLAGWLVTRPLATVAAPTAAPTLATCPVLFKVGAGGPYSLVKIPDVMGMDRMSLLKALKHDDAFEDELKGVALSRCTVQVCASASDEEPSTAEEAAARELRGVKALSALVLGLVGTVPAAGTNVFVRVELPPTPPFAGTAALTTSREFSRGT
jgi:hypothetical protein